MSGVALRGEGEKKGRGRDHSTTETMKEIFRTRLKPGNWAAGRGGEEKESCGRVLGAPEGRGGGFCRRGGRGLFACNGKRSSYGKMYSRSLLRNFFIRVLHRIKRRGSKSRNSSDGKNL